MPPTAGTAGTHSRRHLPHRHVAHRPRRHRAERHAPVSTSSHPRSPWWRDTQLPIARPQERGRSRPVPAALPAGVTHHRVARAETPRAPLAVLDRERTPHEGELRRRRVTPQVGCRLTPGSLSRRTAGKRHPSTHRGAACRLLILYSRHPPLRTVPSVPLAQSNLRPPRHENSKRRTRPASVPSEEPCRPPGCRRTWRTSRSV
jgi:hypothetical protein